MPGRLSFVGEEPVDGGIPMVALLVLVLVLTVYMCCAVSGKTKTRLDDISDIVVDVVNDLLLLCDLLLLLLLGEELLRHKEIVDLQRGAVLFGRLWGRCCCQCLLLGDEAVYLVRLLVMAIGVGNHC